MVKMQENKERKGIELVFDGKPDDKIRAGLKANGFRWNPKTSVWYNKDSEESRVYAKSLMKSAPVKRTKFEAKEIVVNLDDDELDEVKREYYTLDELKELFAPSEVIGNKKRKKITEFGVKVTEEGIVLDIQ